MTLAVTEADIMRDIQLALTRCGARVFRNNVGVWKLEDGRRVRTGLCKGSSDLVGWTHTGRFLALEIKRPGRMRVTKEQQAFIDAVNQRGGLAFVARSAGEATDIYLTQTIPVDHYHDIVRVCPPCMEGICRCRTKDFMPVSKAGEPPYHKLCYCVVQTVKK